MAVLGRVRSVSLAVYDVMYVCVRALVCVCVCVRAPVYLCVCSINSLADVESVHERTKCDGAMAARGLLVTSRGTRTRTRACKDEKRRAAVFFLLY